MKKRPWCHMNDMKDDDEDKVNQVIHNNNNSAHKKPRLTFPISTSVNGTSVVGSSNSNSNHSNNYLFSSDSPTGLYMNHVQEQLSSFSFASPSQVNNQSNIAAMFSSSNGTNSMKKNSHDTHNVEGICQNTNNDGGDDEDNQMIDEDDEHMTRLTLTSKSSSVHEQKFYNVDLQFELFQQMMLKQPLDRGEISLIEYKMAKRIIIDKVDYDFNVGLFSIHVKPIAGIIDCVTPKTDKLQAIFSELFDPVRSRTVAIPLRVLMIDSVLVMQGSINLIQTVFNNGHFKVSIDQWLDKEKNKDCDTIETVYYQKRLVTSNTQPITNCINLYLQFVQELSEQHSSFEGLAFHYLKTRRRDFAGFNLLMHYACRNDVEATMKLIDLGYDLRDVDNMGYNTMYWCQHFAALDVIKAILERDYLGYEPPRFQLRIQVDDPSRLQLTEYNWKHFYLSKFNSVCVIRCKQIIPMQQQLRIRLCNTYEGRVEMKSDPFELDKFELHFSNPNYTGTILVQLYDQVFGRVVAESDSITVYDTSSIYHLMCSDMSIRRSGKRQMFRHFLKSSPSQGNDNSRVE